jgi:hypothetical protein
MKKEEGQMSNLNEDEIRNLQEENHSYKKILEFTLQAFLYELKNSFSYDVASNQTFIDKLRDINQKLEDNELRLSIIQYLSKGE